MFFQLSRISICSTAADGRKGGKTPTLIDAQKRASLDATCRVTDSKFVWTPLPAPWPRPCARIVAIKRRLDLVGLLADFPQHRARIVPVEADLARLGLQLQRAGERGEGDRDAGKRTFVNRLGARRLVLLLLRLDRVPQSLDRFRIAGVLIAKDVRMPTDQLGRNRLDHIAEIERVLLLRHAGMEHDLQQQIAEFFFQVAEIVARNRIGNLIRFLDRVRRDGREILLQIPGAAGFGSTQRGHDLDQPADVAGRGHAQFQACRRP